MINFSQLSIIKESKDNFVGIRKSNSGDNFEFCLPNGFDNFPENDYDTIKDLFFNLYRTFRKFEKDNINSSRFQQNKPEYQDQQDDINISSGGVSLYNDDGEACVIYSKIQMIERVLEAYNDLTIQSIKYKNRRTEEIDYSQIYKYLDRAVYLENDVIYVQAMDLPRPVVNYDSTDIIKLYCYILYEVIQQLNEDVADNIKARIPDIKFFAGSFQDKYLTLNQSLFQQDTYLETINILKNTLEIIDNNTFYKDSDYWQLYEAIEIFLYGKINPNQDDGQYWGIRGFSYVWEDMCHTFFFKHFYQHICYADTDIILSNYHNYLRMPEDKERVGNKKNGNNWIYRSKYNQLDNIGWDEQFNICFSRENNYKRYLRPDLILESKKSKDIWIIDFKNVALDFFQDKSKDKYRFDVSKQIVYELAIQKDKNIKENWFLIPIYTSLQSNMLFKVDSLIKDKGIKVVQANFTLIQNYFIN